MMRTPILMDLLKCMLPSNTCICSIPWCQFNHSYWCQCPFVGIHHLNFLLNSSAERCCDALVLTPQSPITMVLDQNSLNCIPSSLNHIYLPLPTHLTSSLMSHSHWHHLPWLAWLNVGRLSSPCEAQIINSHCTDAKLDKLLLPPCCSFTFVQPWGSTMVIIVIFHVNHKGEN